jgi:hypothetical protein
MEPKPATKRESATQRSVTKKTTGPTAATPKRVARATSKEGMKPRRVTARTVKTRSPKTPAAAAAPPPRRAIFIDVENTSSEANLLRVLEHLKIDRTVQSTELIAAGNWRAVGSKIARLLAGLGAQLVHSAPAVGVRDWSDLWIAVAAGRWLASARPHDTLEIVSDDRAFDAVADAAASVGVTFKRLSYRHIPGSTERGTTAEPARRRRRGGRTPVGRAHEQPPSAHVPAAAASSSTAPTLAGEEAHTASQQQILDALVRLSGDGARWVSLDALANTLRAEGFTRPPGSPRLVVRLRRMKNVQVSANGLVRPLHAGTEAETEAAAPPLPPPRSRRRRRRRRPAANGPAAAAATSDAAEPS